MLKLCPLTSEDCEQVRLWRNECLESLRTPYPITKEMQQDFYKNVVCNRDSKHRYFAIKEDDKLIGMGGLTNIEWENSRVEISLIINPEFRKKGYGKEAVQLLCYEARANMGLKTVWGECYECNPNLGFWKKLASDIAFLPNTKLWGGKYYGSIFFNL